jgi:hypothetical protein
LTLFEIGDGLARARHGLKGDDRIVAEDLALGHDVEVIAERSQYGRAIQGAPAIPVTILVRPTNNRAILLITGVRTSLDD